MRKWELTKPMSMAAWCEHDPPHEPRDFVQHMAMVNDENADRAWLRLGGRLAGRAMKARRMADGDPDGRYT